MSETFPSKATKTQELTETQRNFIDSVPADFSLSDYRVEREVNHTEGNNGVRESTISRMLKEDDSEYNAGLIKKVDEPTIPGIKVVENITKVPDIDLDKLAVETTQHPLARKPGPQDQLLYPNTPNTPAERARARQTAAATPKPGVMTRIKNFFGG